GVAIAHRLVGIGDRRLRLQPLLLQCIDQVGRVLGTDHRYLERTFGLAHLVADHGIHQHHEHDRTDQGTIDQGAEQRALVAQILADFLPEDGDGGFHAASPSSLPINFTNASSRLASPVCARSASGVSSATTLPLAITTMRSHSMATSCMMWLENSTQRPSAFRFRMKARRPRVAITSRPLVGSSRITFFGSCTS